MPKHASPTHHKQMAQKAKAKGNMKGYQHHMEEAKEAAKKKGKK